MPRAILAAPRAAVEIRPSDPPTDPAPGEVRLRIEACGRCHSALFVCTLPNLPLAPVRLGHEAIGRVEAVGSAVASWSPGGRAAITFLGTTCGTCQWCSA